MNKILTMVLVREGKNGYFVLPQTNPEYAKVVTRSCEQKTDMTVSEVEFADGGWMLLTDYTWFSFNELTHERFGLHNPLGWVTKDQREFAKKNGMYLLFVEQIPAPVIQRHRAKWERSDNS